MKYLKIIVPAMAAIMMACTGKNNANNGATNATDSIAADTTEMAAEDSAFNIKVKTYADKKLFKMRYDGSHLFYHTNTISIDWPELIEGCDAKPLYAALNMMVGIKGEDVGSFVRSWAMNNIPDGLEVQVTAELAKKRDEQADYDREDGVSAMYDTECTRRVKFLEADTTKHIVSFEYYTYDDNGCGLGSCVNFFYDYLLYDYSVGKVLVKEDIIANEREAVRQLKKQCIGGDEYGGLEELSSITRLPDTFFFDGSVIMWCFSKYEVSYGADGCPKVGFDVRKCPNVLTDYGKKLFGVEK